uniref:Gasdermin-E n=1 Tax=Sus scrofa TaxID=9823 RepID=A0A8D1SRI4_PIG
MMHPSQAGRLSSFLIQIHFFPCSSSPFPSPLSDTGPHGNPMVSAHGYDVCGPLASAKMTRQSSPAGASFPLADSPAGVWQEPPFLPASSLSPETWQLPGGLARVWFLPFLTNCPLYHCWEINDAGCHLFTSQPSAVRGAKIQAASTSWGHSRAFFFFRTIDLKNPVLQQVLERKNEVLCVLTQKIVTTQQCVISEHVQMEKCGVVGIQLKTVQVSVMDRGNISKGSNVVLEIPAPTTLAYGVIELYLRVDGQFEFCLLQEKHGGFQQTRESSCASLEPLPLLELGFWDMTDALQGASVVDEPLGVLKQVTWLLKRNVHPFAELPEQQQTALNDVLQEVLFDEETLVVLEQVCDSVASSRLLPPLAGLGELKPSQQQQLMAFLQLAGCSVQGGVPDPEDVVSNRKLFSTAYLLVSALAEMPDNAAVLLGTCCKLQIIPTLCHLLYALSDEGMSDLEDPMLAPLKDAETLEIVQHLFALADINLEMLQSSVQATASKDPAVLPLILYISLNGLCALGRAH